MLDFYYFHGLMGRNMYNDVRQCCDPIDGDTCDLSKYIDDDSTCGSLIDRAFKVNIDPYNIYQQCYENTVAVFGSAAKKYHNQFKVNLIKFKITFFMN